MTAGNRAVGVALLRLVVAAAAYGFAIGASKNLLYGWRSALKLPLLLLGTAVICACAYAVTAAFFGLALRPRALLRAAGTVFTVTAVLLGSLAPAVWFLGRTMQRPAGTDLGGYPWFVTTNMLFIAIAGAIGLVRQAALVLQEQRVPRSRALLVIGCWLGLTLAVGGQLAFWLRPFFGIASLTGEPPFLLGSEPTVTGARNFYEVVWQFVRGVDLRR